ncbi:hypothetical protein LJC56_01935 [Christensenellaceae bacterium OttesenSCG-928-K19]|nr:hypothetical protein [Christensenellaceae bacterium OttesenSCG-928-K19]
MEKLKRFFTDDRPLKTKVLIALVASFGCCFTFFIFGPLDLAIYNDSLIPFDFADYLPIALGVGLLFMAVLFAIFMFVKNRGFDILISLFVGILIAGYVQGTFLNGYLGEMTGDAVDWAALQTQTIVNALVWIGLIAIPFLVLRFAKAAWSKLVVLVPVALVAMQLVGLVSTVTVSGVMETHKLRQDEPAPGFLSTQGLFELSSEDNIILLILDRLDVDYTQEILAEDPDYFAPLDGFTYYTNNTSLYNQTYPSVAYMLTGEETDIRTPKKEYLTQAWENATFIPTLQQNGYVARLYFDHSSVYTDIAQLEGIADNIAPGEKQIRFRAANSGMLKLSAYRYAPYLLKPYFWSPADFSPTVGYVSDQVPYVIDDYGFSQALQNSGITLQDRANCLQYYHLSGGHGPFTMDENGQLIEGANYISHIKGCYTTIYEYIRQMKELGIYEDATIIITGDHGALPDNAAPSSAVLPALFVKPSGSSGTPLEVSHDAVSDSQLRASLLAYAGIDSSAEGETYEEAIANHSNEVRHYIYLYDNLARRSNVCTFDIFGDANDYENWKIADQYEVEAQPW